MFSKIKRYFRNNRIFSPLYNKLYSIKYLFETRIQTRNLHKYGYGVLTDLTREMESVGIKVYCAYGTALGLVRDGGFIAHDNDIDLVVLGDEFDKGKIRQIGRHLKAQLIRTFHYEDKIVEIAIRIRGVDIDLFLSPDTEYGQGCYYFYQWENPDPSNENSYRKVIFTVNPAVKDITNIDLPNGYSFPVPSNYEEYLASIYGPTWRTPDDTWVTEDSVTNIDMPGYGICKTPT